MCEKCPECAFKRKNKITKTPFEIELHRVTSNELNFPTQADLRKVAEETRVKMNCDSAIKHIVKKLQTPKEKWRKILKTLNLIDVLCHSGARRIYLELQSHTYMIKGFTTMIHKENSVDVGKESMFISS